MGGVIWGFLQPLIHDRPYIDFSFHIFMLAFSALGWWVRHLEIDPHQWAIWVFHHRNISKTNTTINKKCVESIITNFKYIIIIITTTTIIITIVIVNIIVLLLLILYYYYIIILLLLSLLYYCYCQYYIIITTTTIISIIIIITTTIINYYYYYYYYYIYYYYYFKCLWQTQL